MKRLRGRLSDGQATVLNRRHMESYSKVLGKEKKSTPMENSEISVAKKSESVVTSSGLDARGTSNAALLRNKIADSSVRNKSDVNIQVYGASNATTSSSDQTDSVVNRTRDRIVREDTGSRCLEKIQEESLVKDTITCNINIMDILALLLDKACFKHNQEVPLEKNWVNLAEYFNVPEDVRLQCQRSSQNSPSKNMFTFLTTSQESFSAKRVMEILAEIRRRGLADKLANKLGQLCLPDTTELQELWNNHSEIIEIICLHLDGGGIGNWVDFGRELKAEIPPNKLRQFAKPYSCTEEVLKIIQKREYPEVTVGKMKTTLRDLGRMDVCRALNSLQDNASISQLLNDPDVLEKVTSLLDDETPGVKSWCQFAQKFKMTELECNALRPDGLSSPTKNLLKCLVQEDPGLKVKAFLAGMVKIGRANDVVKILKEFFDANCIDKIMLPLKLEEGTKI